MFSVAVVVVVERFGETAAAFSNNDYGYSQNLPTRFPFYVGHVYQSLASGIYNNFCFSRPIVGEHATWASPKTHLSSAQPAEVTILTQYSLELSKFHTTPLKLTVVYCTLRGHAWRGSLLCYIYHARRCIYTYLGSTETFSHNAWRMVICTASYFSFPLWPNLQYI